MNEAVKQILGLISPIVEAAGTIVRKTTRTKLLVWLVSGAVSIYYADRFAVADVRSAAAIILGWLVVGCFYIYAQGRVDETKK